VAKLDLATKGGKRGNNRDNNRDRRGQPIPTGKAKGMDLSNVPRGVLEYLAAAYTLNTVILYAYEDEHVRIRPCTIAPASQVDSRLRDPVQHAPIDRPASRNGGYGGYGGYNNNGITYADHRKSRWDHPSRRTPSPSRRRSASPSRGPASTVGSLAGHLEGLAGPSSGMEA
ncbi:hypothetical protein JCM11641_004019, partial [Rhodosporidiobolus odoratus]